MLQGLPASPLPCTLVTYVSDPHGMSASVVLGTQPFMPSRTSVSLERRIPKQMAAEQDPAMNMDPEDVQTRQPGCWSGKALEELSLLQV